MLKPGYKIDLDFFSGLQNPSFVITMEDFAALYEEVIKLEKSEPMVLFDGLGFRGIILSEMNSTFIYLQNTIIKLETLNSVKYFKSNSDIILKAINLFKNYDRESNYKILIEKAIDEYL